jgi:3-oxoacyl-[acyl-carrier-protein] synthase-3
LPEQKVSNQQIVEEAKAYVNSKDLTPAHIYELTGVNFRYRAPLSQTATDLAIGAAEKLFKNKPELRDKIDYLVFVSDALDYKGPTTACIIQNKLGLSENCSAIDVLHGCSGYIYGLSIAKAMINSKIARNALLLCADIPTRIIHPEDYLLAGLFSDGGAATYISEDSDVNKIGEFIFGTDGSGAKHLMVERSASKAPASIEWLKQHKGIDSGLEGGRLRMNNEKVSLFALKKVPQLIEQILIKNKLTLSEIDFFVMHQANGTLLNFLQKKMKIPREKFIINIENNGNTVSASIPIAIKQELIETNLLTPGDKILIAGFGIGFSWGGTVISI